MELAYPKSPLSDRLMEGRYRPSNNKIEMMTQEFKTEYKQVFFHSKDY